MVCRPGQRQRFLLSRSILVQPHPHPVPGWQVLRSTPSAGEGPDPSSRRQVVRTDSGGLGKGRLRGASLRPSLGRLRLPRASSRAESGPKAQTCGHVDESQLKRGKRGRNEFRAASLLPPVRRKANRQPRRANSRQTQANQCRARRPDQDLSLLLRGGLSPGEARCGVELGGWKSVSSAVQTAGYGTE